MGGRWAGRQAGREVRDDYVWRAGYGSLLSGDYEAPFFEKYLKDKPGFDLEDTASFRTGENQWHTYAIWPPKVGYHEVRAVSGAGAAAGICGADGGV